jgi:hypothetical protein
LKNQLSSPVMTRLRKSCSVLSCSSIFADTLFQGTCWSSFKCFGTIFAHTFLTFKSCVTIWWTTHSLILTSLVIIRIVKCWSWRMKVLTHSALVLVLTQVEHPDCTSSSTASCPFTKSLCHRYAWARDTKSLPNAFRIFLYVIGSTLPQLDTKFDCNNVARDYSSPFLWCCDKTYSYTNHMYPH